MKGMDRIRRGSSFCGLVRYGLFGEKNVRGHGRIIGGNMSGAELNALTDEFRAIANLRLDVRKPVWHNSLRMPVGEDVSDEKWAEIGREYLDRMGIDTSNHQWLLVKHDPEHVHLIVNRVRLDGALYLGQNENLKSTKIIGQLESYFGLSPTKRPEINDRGKVVVPEVRRRSPIEINRSVRTNEAPARDVIQQTIEKAMVGRPDLEEFMTRLEGAGIEVRAHISSGARKIQGISFLVAGVAFKGSSLGKRFAWGGLSKELGYEEIRDRPALERRSPGTGNSGEISLGEPRDGVAANNFGTPAAHREAHRGAGGVDGGAGRRREPGTTDAHGDEPRIAAHDKRQGRNLGGDALPNAPARPSRSADEIEAERREGLIRTQDYLRNRRAQNLAEETLIAARFWASDTSASKARRSEYRENMLAQFYGASDEHIAKYWRIDREGKTVVYRNKKGYLVDSGHIITATQGNVAEIATMVRLAKLKGWQQITFTGTDDFKVRAMTFAMRSGMPVSYYENDAALYQAVKREVDLMRPLPATRGAPDQEPESSRLWPKPLGKRSRP